MKKQRWMIALLGSVLLTWACESEDQEDQVEQVITDDINAVGHYFSFTAEDFVETYDIALTYQTVPNPAFVVKLNAAAAIYAFVDTLGEFDTATRPSGGFRADSTDSLLIGDQWYTYNPISHTIDTKGHVYFVRGADYVWSKVSLDGASQGAYSFTYAIEQTDGSYSASQSETNLSASAAPVYYDFSLGNAVTPGEWHLGFVTIPVTDPGSGITYYMPSVLTNYEDGAQVGVITDQKFDDVDSVPVDITWLEENADTRWLGYGGTYEVLTYHPEPPYNHKVIVEHPDYVYIVDTGDGEYFKLRFVDYDSGILLMEYVGL
ncbi:MAG: hypothetical protein JSU61_10330 [Fidelibacterota bacterium]|nr:MAG: hypothetical protein JSU61_10330 [Candidatus Neomarinimicrobiota bacterium]